MSPEPCLATETHLPSESGMRLTYACFIRVLCECPGDNQDGGWLRKEASERGEVLASPSLNSDPFLRHQGMLQRTEKLVLSAIPRCRLWDLAQAYKEFIQAFRRDDLASRHLISHQNTCA